MTQTNAACRYDVGMIRDFLMHLRWELRTRCVELTHELPANGKVPKDELYAQMEKYTKKWNCALVRMTTINTDGVPAEEIKVGELKARKLLATQAEQDLSALEHLDRLFEEAFECAAEPCRKLSVQQLSLRRFLDSQEDHDPDSRADDLHQD
jgi:hypothetical protein